VAIAYYPANRSSKDSSLPMSKTLVHNRSKLQPFLAIHAICCVRFCDVIAKEFEAYTVGVADCYVNNVILEIYDETVVFDHKALKASRSRDDVVRVSSRCTCCHENFSIVLSWFYRNPQSLVITTFHHNHSLGVLTHASNGKQSSWLR